MRRATRDDFAAIIASATTKMLEAQTAFDGRAAFAEVDIDQERDLTKAIPVSNVPLVAYYRDGRLVAARVGAGQDVLGRLQQLSRGEPLR